MRKRRAQLVSSGWNVRWTPGVGIEYYLRPKVAFDVALRHHWIGIPAFATDDADAHLRFMTVWIGHYIRF